MPSNLGLKTVRGTLVAKLSRAMIRTDDFHQNSYILNCITPIGVILVSLESNLEDLQNHISQVLTNSEVCALERTFCVRTQLCPYDAEFLTRVRSRTHLTDLAALKP
jgi:hypothetical protein